jgi:dTDP-4-dehydrorhamnose 3,5-epimerase-like enzyme
MNAIPHYIELSKIGDSSLGYVTVAEHSKSIPFEIKRVYWTYYTPNDVIRGHHSHRTLEQVIFAVSGTIEFYLENRLSGKFEFKLDRPNIGLYVPSGYWRTIKLSHNAVLLCLASKIYDEADYIRNYQEFLKIN